MKQISIQDFSVALGPRMNNLVGVASTPQTREAIKTRALELLAELNGNGTFVMLAPGLSMIGVRIESEPTGSISILPQGGFWPKARYRIPGHDADQLIPHSMLPFPRLCALGTLNEFDLYAIEQKNGHLTLHARYGDEPNQVHDFNPAILGSGLHTTNLKAEPHFEQAIERLSKVGLEILPDQRPVNWVPRTSLLFH